MRQTFGQEISDLLLTPERLANIAEGIGNNLHFAFDFDPGCGESAFALSLAKHLKSQPLIVMHIDLNMVTGPEHLAKKISRAAVSAFSGDIKKIDSTIKKLVPTAKTKIVMGNSEEPYIDFEYGTDTYRLLGNLFDVPEMIGMEENRRSVVIWSAFNRLSGIIGEKGMNLFTSKGQRHAITSQVLVGNSISKIAAKMEGKMSNQVRLITSSQLFRESDLLEYAKNGFENAGLEIPDGFAGKIVAACVGQIELIQKLCGEIVRLCATSKQKPSINTLEKAAEVITQNSSEAYLAIWKLLNNRQRSLLFGICDGEEMAIYSEVFINRHGFGTATNLQAALRALCKKELLLKKGKRWAFADPFFREWIRRETGKAE